MVEKSSLNCCKFCGWKFPSDLVEVIDENSDFLFCELCGAEIRYNNVKCQEHDEVIKNSESDLVGNTDKSKNSLWKRFYEMIKNFITENEEGEIQERLTKKEKAQISRVYKDPDFPQIFKSNFIIVFARITYFELKKLKSTANLKNSKRIITKFELKTLTECLKPITMKDIKSEFLKNLYNISQNYFEKWLKKLQSKLKLNPTYYDNFIIYIEWLIKVISKIISELWDEDNLPKFERVICEDMKVINHNKQDISENYVSIEEESSVQSKFNEDFQQSFNIIQIKNIQDAALYLKKVIMPDLIKRGLTVKGYSPGIRVLRDNGHRNFERRIIRLKLNYKDIIKYGNLKEKITRKGKWAFINYNLLTGEELTKSEKFKITKNFFNNRLIPDLIKHNIIEKDVIPTENEIAKGGYSAFIKSLSKGKYKIKYNEFLKLANYKVNKDTEKWHFLDFSEDGSLRTQPDLELTIANYFKTIVVPHLIEKNVIKSFNDLTSKISEKKFQNFLQAARIRNFSFNDIMKAAGYKPNRERSKGSSGPRITRKEWYDLDYDKDGKPLTYERKLEVAAMYLLDTIIPDLLKRNIITKEDMPTASVIRLNNYENYYQSLRYRNIKFNDVLIVGGFEPKESKWNFLIRDINGKLLEKDEKIHHASLYLISTVIPDLLKQRLIKKNQKPSKSILLKGGHRDFLSAIRRDINNLNYTDVLDYASKNFDLGLHPADSIWSFLDYKENYKELKYQEMIEKAANYFKLEIIHNFIKKGYKIENQAPSTLDLVEIGYGGFISAISRRGLYYNDVVKAAGYKPSEYNRLIYIGNLIHRILEWLLLRHSRKRGINSYYEARTSYFNPYYSLKRADNTILIDKAEELFKLSKAIKNLIKDKRNIEIINIDYFIGSSLFTIKHKAQKNYQSEEKLLIIVPLWSRVSQEIPFDVPYAENVLVMTPLEFANFIGYKDKLLVLYLKVINLSLKAVYSDKSLENLSNLADKAKFEIIKHYDYSTNKLIEDINTINKFDLLN